MSLDLGAAESLKASLKGSLKGSFKGSFKVSGLRLTINPTP